MIKEVCDFLKGNQEQITKKLHIQMNEASDKLDFEEAASLRDKIASLMHIKEKQKVFSTTLHDQDIIACARDDFDACVDIFFIRNGMLIGREHFLFEQTNNIEEKELITSFIKQFYSTTEYIPKEIIFVNLIISMVKRFLDTLEMTFWSLVFR